jgi:hypothetical protein
MVRKYCTEKPTTEKTIKHFIEDPAYAHLIPREFLTRTEMCKHTVRYSCLANSLDGFKTTFFNMLVIKQFVNNIFYIGNVKKLIKNLLNTKSQMDNFKFALCFALINATYKLVLCMMRRKVKDDKINSFVAAVAAGIWIKLEPKGRKQLMAVLLLSRAFGVLSTMSVNSGVTREIPYFNMIINVLACGP